MNKNTLFLIGLLLVFGTVITACTSQNPSNSTSQSASNSGAPSNNQGVPNRTGAYRGNLSTADRQAMIQQRRQAAIDACSGKNVGDSCVMENPRANITGTCNALNTTVQCMANRTFNGPRNVTGYGQ